MSRDREGAVGRALRAVEVAGLTRSREAAKEDAKVGFRFSVFGQASRGRESAGVDVGAVCGVRRHPIRTAGQCRSQRG